MDRGFGWAVFVEVGFGSDEQPSIGSRLATGGCARNLPADVAVSDNSAERDACAPVRCVEVRQRAVGEDQGRLRWCCFEFEPVGMFKFKVECYVAPAGRTVQDSAYTVQ